MKPKPYPNHWCLLVISALVVSQIIGLGLFTSFFPQPAYSAQTAPPTEVEQVNVDSIKEKYWARGNEAELGVVQNRTYSKARKIELGLLTGILISDPFIEVKSVGALLAYHFSEYLGVQVLVMGHIAKPSAALTTFQDTLGATTNTNNPLSYIGVEGAGSVLYGKLSVLGKAIIYYDLHLLPGIGFTYTESGPYFTPSIGLGERFYISKLLSLRIDYRLQYYRETFLEKQIVTRLGQPAGTRDNWSNVITLGMSFMFFGD